mgnify:CR=1 FL=1
MASRYRWRQQLLGSLQGQLQLATYLVVFLGFTGASSVGLSVGLTSFSYSGYGNHKE